MNTEIHNVTRMKRERCIEMTNEFVQRRKNGVSYAVVWHENSSGAPRRVCIGNVGAAIAIAQGTLSGFGTVINASGCERTGISLGHLFKSHGRSHMYRTTWNETHLVAQEDRSFLTVENVAASRRRTGEDEEVDGPCGAFIDEHGRLMETYIANHATEAAFHAHVLRGAALITAALDKDCGDTLVHCYAGVNRSAAVIAAFLVHTKRVDSLDIAMEMLTSSAGLRGLKQHIKTRKGVGVVLVEPVLNNKDFMLALARLPVSLTHAHAILDNEVLRVNELLLTKNSHTTDTDTAAVAVVGELFVGDSNNDISIGDPHDISMFHHHQCCVCGNMWGIYACLRCGPSSRLYCSARCRDRYITAHGGICQCQNV